MSSRERNLISLFMADLKKNRSYNALSTELLEGVFEYYTHTKDMCGIEEEACNLCIVDIMPLIDFEKIILLTKYVQKEQLEEIFKKAVEKGYTNLLKDLIKLYLKVYNEEDFILDLFKNIEHTEQMFVMLIEKKYISYEKFVEHGYVNETNENYFKLKLGL